MQVNVRVAFVQQIGMKPFLNSTVHLQGPFYIETSWTAKHGYHGNYLLCLVSCVLWLTGKVTQFALYMYMCIMPECSLWTISWRKTCLSAFFMFCQFGCWFCSWWVCHFLYKKWLYWIWIEIGVSSQRGSVKPLVRIMFEATSVADSVAFGKIWKQSLKKSV